MITRRRAMVAVALGAGAFAVGLAASRWRHRGNSPSLEATTGEAARGEAAWTAGGGRVIRSSSADSPTKAPDFRFTDQHGAEHRFSDWDGVVRVVNFWATWCPPCVHEIPMLITVQESFRAQGVQLVGIAVDDADAAFAMAKELGMSYPTMADPRRTIDLLHAYGNRSAALPFTAFVDPHGSIRDRHVGALTLEQTREKIRALLAPNP